MRAIYRAYCRSVTQANCAPYVLLGAVVLMCVLVLGIDRFAVAHLTQVITVARDTAAVILCGIAAVLLARSARAVATAKGTHYSYHLRVFPVPAPGRIVIGEHADGTPATADVAAGAYTWKIRPPAPGRVPGKSDLVSQWAAGDEAAGLTGRDGNRVKWTADATEMAADADALRDGDMEVLISPRGSIFECNDADLLEGP